MKKLFLILAVFSVLFVSSVAYALPSDTKPFYSGTSIYGRCSDTDIDNVAGKWYPITIKADGSIDARLTNGAPELTEYQVDESNWDIYGSITTTSSVGYTFKTVTNNYIDYVDINLKNTTAVNLNNITMYLSFYGDTVSYPLIKQVSTKDTWVHGDTKLVRFLVGLPILNNRTYYWELTSDTTVTNIQAVLVDIFATSDSYSRGTAYINRTACNDTSPVFTGIPFNMYTRSMNFVTTDQNDTQLYGYTHVTKVDSGFMEIIDLDTGITDVPWVGNVDRVDSASAEITNFSDSQTNGYVNVQDTTFSRTDLSDSETNGYTHVKKIDTGTMDIPQVDNVSSVDKVDSCIAEIVAIPPIDFADSNIIVESGVTDVPWVGNVDRVDSASAEITNFSDSQTNGYVNIKNSLTLADTAVEIPDGVVVTFSDSAVNIPEGTRLIGRGGDSVVVTPDGEMYVVPSPQNGDSFAVSVINVPDVNLADTSVRIPDGVTATLSDTAVTATLTDTGVAITNTVTVTQTDTSVNIPTAIYIRGISGDSVAVSANNEMLIAPSAARGDSLAVYMVGGTLTTTSSDTSVNIPEGITLADSNVNVESGVVRLWDTTRYSSILGNSAVADAATKLGVASEVEDFDLSGGTEDYTGAMGLLGASTSGAKPVYVDAANGRLEVIVQDLTDSTVQMTYGNTGDSVPVNVINSSLSVIPTDGTTVPINDPVLDFTVTETIWEKNILGASAYTGDSYMYLAGSGVETWCLMVGADTVFAEINISSVATTTYQMYEVGNTVSFGTAIAAPRNLNRSSTNTSTVVFYSGTTSSDLGTQLAYSAGTRGTMTIELKPNQAYIWIIRNGIGGSESVYCNIRYFHY